jgi:hypothetical protein
MFFFVVPIKQEAGSSLFLLESVRERTRAGAKLREYKNKFPEENLGSPKRTGTGLFSFLSKSARERTRAELNSGNIKTDSRRKI